MLVRRHLDRKTPWRLVKKYCRATGIEPERLGSHGIGVHSLRKTAINDAIRNGASLHEVREFAGHADIRTTELYFMRKEEDGEVAAHPDPRDGPQGPLSAVGQRFRQSNRDSTAELQACDEVVHFLLGLVLLVAVVSLELADQCVPLAADERPVVVGQHAPLGLELPGELTPLALEYVPVHG
jgi:hypothetical protein